MGITARSSDRRIGERMVADEVQWLGTKAQELLHMYDQERPSHTLRTFADVERLWANVVRPMLKDFQSMQPSWPNQEAVPEGSVWYENWSVPDLEY
jgi:hypothetical protein